MFANRSQPDEHLTNRQRTRLRLARERGYLTTMSSGSGQLLAVYSRWCWRLRLPVICAARRSPHSRYGRIHLDLYTTPNRMTTAGQLEMRALGNIRNISPHDASWDWVPLADLDRLAAAILRAAMRPANCQAHRLQPAKIRFIDMAEAV